MEENKFLKTPTQISENNLSELMENIILKITKEDGKALIYHLNNLNFAFALATNERKSFILDNNPLTKIQMQCQFSYPSSTGLKNRLKEIKTNYFEMPTDMSKYFTPKIYNELLSFKEFLKHSPNDSINLWIKYLINIFLTPTNTQIPQDMELKEFILNKYKHIYQNVSPVKLLILNPYIPNFVKDTTNAESIFSQKTHLICYSPPSFEGDKFCKQNLLRMWFFDIKEQDILNIGQINLDQQLNQNFIFINKILETGGILYIETQNIQKMEKFFKISSFYGYKNIQHYTNSNAKNILLLRKSF